MAPNALDANDARARIADLKSLLSLPGQKGVEVRRLYASEYGSLAERKYDRALTDLTKAGDLAPEFPLTRWKLGLLNDMGDVDQARENFTRYQQLSSDQSAKDEANLHLTTLDAKRAKYDEEVDEAEDIVADLFNRSMKLTFNGSERRSAVRVKRAQVKKKEQNKARKPCGWLCHSLCVCAAAVDSGERASSDRVGSVSPRGRGQRVDGIDFLTGQRRPFRHQMF